MAIANKYFVTRVPRKPRMTKILIDSRRKTVTSDESITTRDIHILEVLGLSDSLTKRPWRKLISTAIFALGGDTLVRECVKNFRGNLPRRKL